MIVRFSSIATEPLIMFGDVAVRLIRMLGATGTVPGALSAEDLPAAIKRLDQALAHAADMESGLDRDQGEDEDPAPVELSQRALPLVALLKRANAGNAPVMWEAA